MRTELATRGELLRIAIAEEAGSSFAISIPKQISMPLSTNLDERSAIAR